MHNEHWDYHVRTNTNLSSTLGKGLEWSLDAVDLSLQKAVIALSEAQVLDGDAQTAVLSEVLDSLWRSIEGSNLLVLDSQGRVVHRTQGVQSIGKQFIGHDLFKLFV